jgi:hypothetical protein
MLYHLDFGQIISSFQRKEVHAGEVRSNTVNFAEFEGCNENYADFGRFRSLEKSGALSGLLVPDHRLCITAKELDQ